MAEITSCAGGRHNMPRPLQVDLLTFKVVSKSRVICATFSLPRRPSVLNELRPDVRDRQTSDRQTSDAHRCLMPLALGAGHNEMYVSPR